MPFTPEELEEMRRADAEIEAEFTWTNEELTLSRELDRAAELAAMLPERRKLAEYKRQYYEANKDKLAEYQRQYYEANKDKLAEYQRQYYEANKDKLAEYQRQLKDARRTIGYSQRELAKIVGCSQPMISRLESGALRLDGFADRKMLLEILGLGGAAAPLHG